MKSSKANSLCGVLKLRFKVILNPFIYKVKKKKKSNSWYKTLNYNFYCKSFKNLNDFMHGGLNFYPPKTRNS